MVEAGDIVNYARNRPAQSTAWEPIWQGWWNGSDFSIDNEADAAVDPEGNMGYDGAVHEENAFSVAGIEGYEYTINNMVNIDATTLMKAAKDGIRHGGVYRDAIGKKRKNLEKSISSHTNQVLEHWEKIKCPEEYDLEWNEKDNRQKEGLLRKWERDLRRNAEQAEIEIEVWKELYGNEH